jgi:hypothetical protein
MALEIIRLELSAEELRGVARRSKDAPIKRATCWRWPWRADRALLRRELAA